MTVVGIKKITVWGKSMYGGWYANWYDQSTDEWGGEHERTLNELCAKLHLSRTALNRDVQRFDN